MYARCQRRSIRTDTLSSGRPTGAQRQMEMQQKLQEMQPILLDVLPLTLEEVFTYEMETLGYTFHIDELQEEKNHAGA